MEQYMKEALKEAKKAYEKKEVPVGAVIVKDNKIIARAHNIRESKQNAIILLSFTITAPTGTSFFS